MRMQQLQQKLKPPPQRGMLKFTTICVAYATTQEKIRIKIVSAGKGKNVGSPRNSCNNICHESVIWTAG